MWRGPRRILAYPLLHSNTAGFGGTDRIPEVLCAQHLLVPRASYVPVVQGAVIQALPGTLPTVIIPRHYARHPTPESATQNGHAWSSAMQELLPRALPQLSCSHLAGPPVPLMLA